MPTKLGANHNGVYLLPLFFFKALNQAVGELSKETKIECSLTHLSYTFILPCYISINPYVTFFEGAYIP